MKKQLAAVTLFFAVLAAMTVAAAAGKTTATVVGDPEYESVDFAEFNKTVAEAAGKSEAWTMDPVLVALKLAGPSEGMTQNIERVYGSAESPAAEVIITNEKLPDDSVMGQRFVIVLGKNDDGSWTVKSAGKAVKCYEGRGHQDYSKEPCM